MNGIEGLGPGFIRRVERTSLVAGSIGLLVLWAYAGPSALYGGVAGLALTLLNLRLLEILFRNLLRPEPQWNKRVAAALLLKLPLLMGGAALSLYVLRLPPLWFSVGFSFPLAVALLKVLGQMVNHRISGGAANGAAATATASATASASATKSVRHGVYTASLVLGVLGLASLVLALGLGVFTRATVDGDLERWVGAPAAVAQEHGSDTHAADTHAADTHAADTHAADTHAADGHGDDAHAAHSAHPEFPNWIHILYVFNPDAEWAQFLQKYNTPIFSLMVIIIIAMIAMAASRNPKMVPGPLQNAVEMGVEGFHEFVSGILGHDAKRYLPFLGTLFVYIWFSNLMGLIPLQKAPTSVYNTTLALAICVFAYVQFTGLTRLGPAKYLKHLMGDPEDAIGWAMVPLLLPLHLIGELAKPLSLSLRLFGNILGEDVLLAVFGGLGVTVIATMMGTASAPFGIPLHLPFIFLSILLGSIQALVFTLLTTLYFSQVLPHGEHEEHGEHGEHAAHGATGLGVRGQGDPVGVHH